VPAIFSTAKGDAHTEDGALPYPHMGYRWRDWQGSWNKKHDLYQHFEKNDRLVGKISPNGKKSMLLL